MATMKSANPWDPTSEYAIMAKQLMNWEHQLPADHRWSMVLLKGHKTVGEDLVGFAIHGRWKRILADVYRPIWVSR